MHTPYNKPNQDLSHSCDGTWLAVALLRAWGHVATTFLQLLLWLCLWPQLTLLHIASKLQQCRGTYPVPLHFLSWLERPGSVKQLQQKPKQQHSFMKRRMRSE